MGICTIGTKIIQTHTKKGGWYEFFYIKNTQKTILKTRLYELIRSAFSQPFVNTDKVCIFYEDYDLMHKVKLAIMSGELVPPRD